MQLLTKYSLLNANLYHNFIIIQKIAYVLDKNDMLVKSNRRIQRSKLILQSSEVISDVAKLIRDRRNYKAIALLTEHNQKLMSYIDQHKDESLERDAKVLDKYAKQLYKFDEQWIQFLQIKQDLDWDNARFATVYQ